MKKGLSFRPRTRVLAALLAAWMMVFAATEAVHTHAAPVTRLAPSSVSQPTIGGSQSGICLACLASHNPAPAAYPGFAVPVPRTFVAIQLVQLDSVADLEEFPAVPSRAPPAHSSTAQA